MTYLHVSKEGLVVELWYPDDTPSLRIQRSRSKKQMDGILSLPMMAADVALHARLNVEIISIVH